MVAAPDADVVVAPAATDPGPVCGIDDERTLTFGLLLEAHARLTRLLDADLVASDGISLQTFEVLLRIGRSPEGRVTMSQLAGAVALTTGGVTRLADRLERDGLVRRASCPTDRRVVHLTLTERGRSTLEAALAHHVGDLDRRVASRLDPADVPALQRALDVLRRDPDDDAAPAR